MNKIGHGAPLEFPLVNEQYYGKSDSFTGEQKLWFAVLLDAAFVYHRLHKVSNNEHCNAVEWFESNHSAFGSFMFVCEMLNLNPNATRRLVYSSVQRENPRRSYERKGARLIQVA